ncbi:MAG TPA: aminoacyl-tRNA deacylase [Candidatus Limnocylindrales bacterium]|nr:aminoacyl-tRNA deacylase [Candidatus Limnocylindrales bacterium]
MKNKLNSMRLLEQHNVPYEVVEFDDSLRDAEVIAESLGIPPYMVYKTLVAEPEGGSKPFLVLLAADRRLNLKRLAQAAGVKKVRMAAHKDAEALTGLKVGGISALALTHKNWAVFLDRSATELQHVLVSGGQRGVDLRLPVTDLIRVVRARIADVSDEGGGEAEE